MNPTEIHPCATDIQPDPKFSDRVVITYRHTRRKDAPQCEICKEFLPVILPYQDWREAFSQR